MSISQGARSQFNYVSETVWGTTPALPETQTVPFMTFGVNLTKDNHEDNSIQADGMAHYLIPGNRHVGGDLDVNFCHGNYNPFLKSLMLNDFDTHVLKKGTTRYSMSGELKNLDIGVSRIFTGLIVDKMQVTVPTSGFVTAKFSLVGKDMTIGATSLDATPTAPTAKKPLVHNGGSFKEGGTTIGYLQSITFTVDNGYSMNNVLGSDVARDATYAMQKISGTVVAYFEDASMATKFMNGSASSIEFELTDGTNTCNFKFPEIYYTGANQTVQGAGPITLTMTFVAVKNEAAGTNMIYTESA